MALSAPTSGTKDSIVSSVNIFATALNTVYYTVPANCYLEGHVFLSSNGTSFKVFVNGTELPFNLSTTYQGDVPKPLTLNEGDTIGTGANAQYWTFSGVVRSKV